MSGTGNGNFSKKGGGFGRFSKNMNEIRPPHTQTTHYGTNPPVMMLMPVPVQILVQPQVIQQYGPFPSQFIQPLPQQQHQFPMPQMMQQPVCYEQSGPILPQTQIQYGSSQPQMEMNKPQVVRLSGQQHKDETYSAEDLLRLPIYALMKRFKNSLIKDEKTFYKMKAMYRKEIDAEYVKEFGDSKFNFGVIEPVVFASRREKPVEFMGQCPISSFSFCALSEMLTKLGKRASEFACSKIIQCLIHEDHEFYPKQMTVLESVVEVMKKLSLGKQNHTLSEMHRNFFKLDDFNMWSRKKCFLRKDRQAIGIFGFTFEVYEEVLQENGGKLPVTKGFFQATIQLLKYFLEALRSVIKLDGIQVRSMYELEACIFSLQFAGTVISDFKEEYRVWKIEEKKREDLKRKRENEKLGGNKRQKRDNKDVK